ncbi:MAG: HAD family hydrolase [Ktedonobacteraceae bacterium]
MIHALIFDFDGLILDTEESEFQTWQEVYAEHNARLPLDQWATAIGGGLEAFDVYGYLEAQIGRTIQREDIAVRRRERNRELLALKTVLPGVETYLVEAKRLGLKRAVASSSSRAWVTDHLSRLGLLESFDYLRCGDEVTHRKPDPELYLDVLKEFGITGDQAIVLEDSPNGVRAAQAAGIFCVAIPNVVTGQLPLDHADLRLASMADMPLEKLLALVESKLCYNERA